MFTSAKFRNFKSLKDFTVPLKRVNVLVGPNNAGKSSVLDAFRALSAAQAFASRRNPTLVRIGGETVSGYEIPLNQIPISLENIHSNYDSENETSVTFQLESGNRLKLHFFENSRCILIAENKGRQIQTIANYKRNYPLSIAIFPTLGPLEEEEQLVDPDYLRRWQSTRRSNRLFRNIWYQKKGDFQKLASLVESTWPGMTISPPERQGLSPPRLIMFCKENRVDREVSWAGFGFQVWLQLLTHLLNAADATTLVVDEPEIYLHPDLQRRLFLLLRATSKQLIMATHSSEIVNEAEHDDTRNDASTVFNEAIHHLDARWTTLTDKLAVVGGKHFLSSLNSFLQQAYGISITATQIVRALTLPADCELRRILVALDSFAARQA